MVRQVRLPFVEASSGAAEHLYVNPSASCHARSERREVVVVSLCFAPGAGRDAMRVGIIRVLKRERSVICLTLNSFNKISCRINIEKILRKN